MIDFDAPQFVDALIAAVGFVGGLCAAFVLADPIGAWLAGVGCVMAATFTWNQAVAQVIDLRWRLRLRALGRVGFAGFLIAAAVTLFFAMSAA